MFCNDIKLNINKHRQSAKHSLIIKGSRAIGGILICHVLVIHAFSHTHSFHFTSITHVFSSIHHTCRAAAPNKTPTVYLLTLVSCSTCKIHILMPLIIICEAKTSYFYTVRESESVIVQLWNPIISQSIFSARRLTALSAQHSLGDGRGRCTSVWFISISADFIDSQHPSWARRSSQQIRVTLSSVSLLYLCHS